MVQFIVLICFGVIGLISWRFYQQHQENKLRTNFPRRRCIEVSLPRGVDDSNKRMQKFYGKAVTATQGDAKARRTGFRQVDIVYLAEVKQGHTQAEVRFLVYADEDKMDALKRSLKQVFDGMAHVQELTGDNDPMEEIAAQMRPPKEEESTEEIEAGEENVKPHVEAKKIKEDKEAPVEEEAVADVTTSSSVAVAESSADEADEPVAGDDSDFDIEDWFEKK